MIHAVTSLDENTLYSISNHLEPREGKEPGDRPPELDTYRTDKRDVFLKSVPVKSVSQSALVRISLFFIFVNFFPSCDVRIRL